MSAAVDLQARGRMVQRRPHTPNLFDLMPYRRVRGAFPAWLLSWADAAHADAHPGLHTCARVFLDALLAAGGRELPADSRHIAVHRNLDGADVAAILDTGTVVLLLERLNGQGPIHRLDRLRGGRGVSREVRGAWSSLTAGSSLDQREMAEH